MAADHGKKLYAAQPESANGWYVLAHDAEGHGHIDSGDGGFEEDDARRLAASWNACLQIETAWLEEIQPSSMRHLVRTMLNHGDLLAALENLAALYDTDEGCRSTPEYVAARKAIAKAKGES